MNDIRQMMARAQKLQAKVSEVQKNLENVDVKGTSGSGSVEVTMTVGGAVKSISLKEEIVDPKEKDLLEDLIVAALNDARNEASKIYESEMAAATGGLKLPGLI
jgi:DNA-binding YbaB/EbfC family protein